MFKDGEVVVRDGKVVKVVGRYHRVQPDYDPGIERRLGDYFDRYQSMRANHRASRPTR